MSVDDVLLFDGVRVMREDERELKGMRTCRCRRGMRFLGQLHDPVECGQRQAPLGWLGVVEHEGGSDKTKTDLVLDLFTKRNRLGGGARRDVGKR